MRTSQPGAAVVLAALVSAVLGAGCSPATPATRPTAAPAAAGAVEKPPEETLSLAGVEMAYVDRGEGEPALVFVHCGNCRKEIWTETLDAFAPAHRVVAMDLPGHGRSGFDLERLTIGDLGADVAALAEHLGLGRVILIGNSLGGPVALEAAARLGPERVLGVVAVDTLHDVSRRWTEEDVRSRAEGYRRDFEAACDELMLSLLPENAPPPVRARIEHETCDNDPRAAAAQIEAIPDYDQAASIAAAGVPVRAINSTVFPTAVEVNRRHAVSFEVTLMDGIGHYPQVERPEEFQRHLRTVVDELTAGPPRSNTRNSPEAAPAFAAPGQASAGFGRSTSRPGRTDRARRRSDL